MINYSIIIPHKNIPKLLQRCLDSIPRREDVQIIIVDDNSDTDKVDFANFPGLNDHYIEVIFGKNENGRKGAGYARNLGLERANGKWIVFADADDFFLPCFSDILDKYKDDENNIIYFKVTSVDSDTLEPANRDYSNAFLDEVQQTGNLDLLYKAITPWGKLIKKSLIDKNNIRFPEIFCSEDVLFCIYCIYYAFEKIIIDNNIIYCITARAESLTSQMQVTVKFLKISFFVGCESVVWLNRHNKKNCCKWLPYYYWDDIYHINKKEAFYLLPHMAKACGWIFVFKRVLVDENVLGFGKPLYLFYRKYIKNKLLLRPLNY